MVVTPAGPSLSAATAVRRGAPTQEQAPDGHHPELTSLRSARVTAAHRLARAQLPRQGAPLPRRGTAGRTGGRRASRGPRGRTLVELYATPEAAERHADLVEAARAAGSPVLPRPPR